MDSGFGVGVEVLLLLVDEGLGLEGVDLVLLEVSDGGLVLYVGLRVLEVGQLPGPLPLLFALLLLSQLQLFVADFPELGEVLVLGDLGAPLGLLPLDLELTASLDGGLHLGLPLLLLLVESVRSVFGLGHLPVQHFFLVVLQRAQLFDLAVDHALASLLFVSKSLNFSLLLHVLESFTFLSKGFDLLFFFNLLTAFSFFDLHELSIGRSKIGTHLGDLLLTCNFSLLFALQVFLCLPLDKFTLEHLLLELLDEVELEVFELLADVLRVDLLELVLLLELGAHLLIVLGHLGLLDLDPMALDILSNCLLAAGHYLLSLLLVRHVAHEHLTL